MVSNPFYAAEARHFQQKFGGNWELYLQDLANRTELVAVGRDDSSAGSNLCLHMLMVLGVESGLILRHPEALNRRKIAGPLTSWADEQNRIRAWFFG